MSRRTQIDKGVQQGNDGGITDDQTETAIEIEPIEPVIVVSKTIAIAMVIGLCIVLILVGLQSFLTYNQGLTIKALRCTAENQSDTLASQAGSLEELVTLRKRQDRFNTLLQDLIVATRKGNREQADHIIDQFEEEQRRRETERGAKGEQGPQGPRGRDGRSTTSSSTSSTSTTSRTGPVVTLPSIPFIPIAASTSCREGN